MADYFELIREGWGEPREMMIHEEKDRPGGSILTLRTTEKPHFEVYLEIQRDEITNMDELAEAIREDRRVRFRSASILHKRRPDAGGLLGFASALFERPRESLPYVSHVGITEEAYTASLALMWIRSDESSMMLVVPKQGASNTLEDCLRQRKIGYSDLACLAQFGLL
jgi:hypothetical protein